MSSSIGGTPPFRGSPDSTGGSDEGMEVHVKNLGSGPSKISVDISDCTTVRDIVNLAKTELGADVCTRESRHNRKFTVYDGDTRLEEGTVLTPEMKEALTQNNSLKAGWVRLSR